MILMKRYVEIPCKINEENLWVNFSKERIIEMLEKREK